MFRYIFGYAFSLVTATAFEMELINAVTRLPSMKAKTIKSAPIQRLAMNRVERSPLVDNYFRPIEPILKNCALTFLSCSHGMNAVYVVG